MQRLQVRDPAALGELYDNVSRRAFGLAMRIVGEREAAASVVEQSFDWLWRNASNLEPTRGRPEALLLAVVHRRAVEARRGIARPEGAAGPDWAAFADAPDDPSPFLTEDLFRASRDSFANLPTEQQYILDAVYFEGLRQDEVASRTGLPRETVRSRVRLGLEGLRAMLGGQ